MLMANIHGQHPWPTSVANIHLAPGAPESPPDAEVVRGSYDFHHFGSGGLDDRGWGCAYRSLQTIASWALRPPLGTGGREAPSQSSFAVPTHLEVQEALELCGDKPPGFAGSREWIGSFELGLLLDALLGLPSRILPFNCGRELPQAAPSLASHFASGGGPVMCGGGSAAVTLLGVAPGAPVPCALVLDPHFFRARDSDPTARGAAEVAAAGCLNWRDLSEIAPEGAHCNLLLPKRPPTKS